MADIFSNIITRSGRKIQKTDSAYATKLKDFANDVYERLYERFFWNDLFREIKVTVAAASGLIILPRNAELILYVSDQTNDILIRKVGVQNFQKRYLPELGTSGHIYNYASWGYSPVAVQLSTADMIEVLSSSASDITQKVYIRGYDSNGIEVNESITLTGATAAAGLKTIAAYVATNPRSGLSMIAKDADTAGVITIREKTADTVLGYLGPLERTARHKIIKPVFTPSASVDLYVGFKEPFRKLVNDGDVTQFSCETLLVQGIFIEALKEQRQFQRATLEEQSFEKNVALRLQEEERDQEIIEEGAIPEMDQRALDLDRTRVF